MTAGCAACRILDAADGRLDDHFGGLPTPRTEHAGRLAARLSVAETFGGVAERFARFLGTARYLAYQTAFVIVWISLNLAAVSLRWDPYPFILLNLAFSTQAAYAAPLILLAQNRQTVRDKVHADTAYATGVRTEVWSVHIGQALGIDPVHVEGIVARAVADSRPVEAS